MARVAIVTGAAHGIGRACARRLGRDGYHVVATDVDRPALDAMARDLAAGGHSVEPHELDVADVPADRALVEATVARHGRIDALVNNAGYTERVYLDELTPERWQRMLGVLVRGPTFLAQAVTRHMVERGEGGAIVNVTSIRAETAEPGQVHYCAAKGALRTLTRVMALELGPAGIRVNCVGPGLTRTRMTEDVRSDPQALTRRKARVPLARYAEPEEIAGSVAFLLSDQASFITGATLYVDGGFLAGSPWNAG